MRPSFAPTAAAALLAAACAAPGTGVVRVVEGQPAVGPTIAPEVYGAYARAAWDEAHGELAAAEAGYRAVLERDDGAARAWVRLGAVRCRLAHHDDAPEGGWSARAESAFDAAESLAPGDPALWEARARCALLHDRPAEALEHARHAATLEAAPELGELVAEAALAADDPAEARRWVLATAVRAPRRVAVWELARTVARALADAPLLAEAERRLGGLGAEAAAARPAALTDLAPLDAALARGELEVARRLAVSGRVAPGTLALRGAALGCPGVGDYARTLLAADPESADAAVAALVTATTPTELDAALRGATALEAPTTLGVWLLAELLHRRVGAEAARAWLAAAHVDATTPGDALLAAVRARVEAALSAPPTPPAR